MIGVKSILDIWWQLAGIFAGGMLGLFLLGMISRSTGNAVAKVATLLGILVILWMTFSYLIPEQYSVFRNSLHVNMVIVIGTLTIFLSGILLTRLRLGRAGAAD
jgi:solute:Na+ symporter, SSS family